MLALSTTGDLAAARRVFIRALRVGTIPAHVTSDRTPFYPRVLDELVLGAAVVERYANNPVEADHRAAEGQGLLVPQRLGPWAVTSGP